MELQGATYLFTLAALSVTFVGFSALVIIIRQTLGGQSIQSNEFEFPVDVCFGCLVTVPPGAQTGYCQGLLPLASSNVACELGQDQYSDCQSCYSCKTGSSSGPACASGVVPACNLTP